MQKIFSSIGIGSTLFLSLKKIAFAQQDPLTNPAIGSWGNNAEQASSGATFVTYFTYLWQSLITIGAIAVIILFLWAAIEWITAGGDSSKLESARNKMINAVIGLFILVTSYTLIGFISWLIFGEQFNILNPTFLFGAV